jgi:hypothetical protein
VCPECGTEITVTAVVPSFLLAAIEALAEEGDTNGPFSGIVDVTPQSTPVDLLSTDAVDGAVTESYCEYFRRQLSHVDCVEDALHEIDASR